MSKKNALFPEVKDAIEFSALWQQVSEIITTLSGDVWSDTGDHDPGITMLQSATWNCSDLSYRTSLPLNDLLTAKDQETLFPIEFGPDNVLTCNTVTAEDYRRALLDLHSRDISLDTLSQDFLFSDVCLIKEPEESRFHWWYNEDEREYSFKEPTDAENVIKLTLRGNVWLSVIPTRYTQSLSSENIDKVKVYLDNFLADHRALGEQVSRITWLEAVSFIPKMTIELSENISDVNQVAAEIYQVLETFLRPTAVHYTTEQKRALGEQNEAIFEGPRLQYGWLHMEPSLISPEGYLINLSPLITQLLAIPGVDSLNSLSIDTDTKYITPVKGEDWSWQVTGGYFPLLWGETPLSLLASVGGPLTLVAKGGIRVELDSQIMASYLTVPDVVQIVPMELPAGRVRDLNSYTPVGQRLPECYFLQQPNSVIDESTRALHQFLLLADQLLVDGNAELALLPELLAFKQRGNFIRGTQWPYINTSVQQDIHLPYAEILRDFQQQNASIFLDEDGKSNWGNFFRELDFIEYLLGYFGTHRADLPLTLDFPDFLATQRAYLAQQPELGYNRTNIRIDRVSALQKRIAARIGLGSICFDDNPDLTQLPFYLIEHRQLLPQLPDSTYDSEHTPAEFKVDEPKVTLTQSGSAGKIILGQLIDLIAIEGDSRLYVRRLLVIDTKGDSFTCSTDNSQQLLNNIERLTTAFSGGNLRWQNSNVWLQDMDYRLNYAATELQPSDKQQRLLASNAQSPYPAMVRVDDVIVLRPAGLQFSMRGGNENLSTVVDPDWKLEATIKAVDPITGTLLIEKASDSTTDFPSEENSFRYQWTFSRTTYATADRFSFVVSAVFNHSLLDKENIEPERLVEWVQETIMAEFPAHVSLINHWLEEAAFRNFGAIYARWQNSGAPLGDDAFAIMQILTLGHLPITQLEIGLMRIATEAQRTEAIGSDGSEWHPDVILREELFYVPQNEPVTLEHNDLFGEKK